MTRSKFERRLRRARAHRGPPAGVLALFWVAVVALAAAAGARLWVASVVLALALLAPCAVWVRGRVLLAQLPARVRVVVMTSRSPRWERHIQERWLGPLGPAAECAVWTERRETVPHRLWRHFGGGTYPGALVLRGWRHPTVYPFYWGFEAQKHGDGTVLAALEAEMFRELGVDGAG